MSWADAAILSAAILAAVNVIDSHLLTKRIPSLRAFLIAVALIAIFYGGIAQVCAGIMEWKKGNTFGTTAFISYGFFWLSLVALIVLPSIKWGVAPENYAMAAYLLMWGVFTAFMFIGTLKLTRTLQFIFGSLTVLFFLLAIGDITGNQLIKLIAGYEGIICGLAAIYTALGQVLNELYGRTLVPL